jgi:hypothetical protein
VAAHQRDHLLEGEDLLAGELRVEPLAGVEPLEISAR